MAMPRSRKMPGFPTQIVGLPQNGRKPGARYTRYPSGEHEKRGGAGRAAPPHKTKEGTIQSKTNSQERLFHKEEKSKKRGWSVHESFKSSARLKSWPAEAK